MHSFRKLADEIFLKGIRTSAYIDEPMSRHTSFKIGGPCDLMLSPASCGDLLELLAFLKTKGIRPVIVGNGSNLLVSDLGVRGVIVKIAEGAAAVRAEGNRITAEAGAMLSKVSSAALRASLSGLEFASGIPGSIGGAVFMNAGAYDGEMSRAVFETEYADGNLQIMMLSTQRHEFSYRESFFSKNRDCTIIRTTLKLSPAPEEQILKKTRQFSFLRAQKQPLDLPSAGSVFKRPEGAYAGRLIEDAGLKGKTIGGAMVSPKHGGFIVNTGGAAANDVYMLIGHIKNEVKKKFNVQLECEIRLLGEFGGVL